MFKKVKIHGVVCMDYPIVKLRLLMMFILSVLMQRMANNMRRKLLQKVLKMN